LIKHLVSGYLKKDTGEKLGELVRRTKDWASKVILAMQAMEQQDHCDPGDAQRAMEYLHEYIVTSVVLCCSVCKQAISGTFTTADGAVFHNACFKCETCKKPISVSYFEFLCLGVLTFYQGSYFREGSKIYCSEDIPMINNLICKRCGEQIELGSNYLEVRTFTYHRE
jgi:hypothetical protein